MYQLTNFTNAQIERKLRKKPGYIIAEMQSISKILLGKKINLNAYKLKIMLYRRKTKI